jgi:hypothetical protein
VVSQSIPIILGVLHHSKRQVFLLFKSSLFYYSGNTMAKFSNKINNFMNQVVSLPSRIDPHQTSAVVTLHGQLFVRVPFEQSE